MLTLALAVAGCGGDHPRVTGPRDVVEPPPGPTWDVTIEVRPGPGGTAAGADVQVASTVPVAGLLELHIGSADESGRLTFTGLAPNTYIVAARAAGNVAADTLRVTADGAPAVQVLQLVQPGAFRGRVTLQGRSHHDGVFVSSLGVVLPFELTDATGAFRLGGVPPGRWMVDFDSPGFRPAQAAGTVPSAGDTVDLAPVSLVHS